MLKTVRCEWVEQGTIRLPIRPKFPQMAEATRGSWDGRFCMTFPSFWPANKDVGAAGRCRTKAAGTGFSKWLVKALVGCGGVKGDWNFTFYFATSASNLSPFCTKIPFPNFPEIMVGMGAANVPTMIMLYIDIRAYLEAVS